MEIVLEIGTEEIPPGYIPPALASLESEFASSLERARIGHARIRSLGTPRRLVLIAEGVADKAEDSRELVFGPPARAAFDEAGKPTRAAEGFAKTQGVDPSDLKVGKKDKGDYVCVEKVIAGEPVVDHLPSVVRALLLGGIPFPKTMKWEEEGRRFARPIRWLTLVVDGRVTADTEGRRFSWAGLAVGEKTRGHRFLAPGEFAVKSATQYVDDLRRNFVIVDHEERRRLIRQKIDLAASSVGGRVVEDEDLLERITFMTEHPHAILGSFSADFLKMPGAVVVTALREHQNFFSVSDGAGRLMPYFVAVADVDGDRAGKIKAGNERVLEARLEDATFYWHDDLRVGLENMVGRLPTVVWQEQLGSLMDKTLRVVDLAAAVVGLTGTGEVAKAKRAAYLAKADLTSQMVREKEFSSLQGYMGARYAEAAGEDAEVARAISEHYLPRFADDVLPETPTGLVLALADKLDTLVGCFAVGLIPTGSEDPYALRRQAAGVARILVERDVHLSLEAAVSASIALYGSRIPVDARDLKEKILAFIRPRLETLLTEAGLKPDVVQSVLDAGLDDPALAASRARAVGEFVGRPGFDSLITAFKRAHNITKGKAEGDPRPDLFETSAESDLYLAYRTIKPRFEGLVRDRRFHEALEALSELRGPTDAFFQSVMVMVDDEGLRQNRLNLLGAMTRLFLEIADFSRVEVAR